MAAIVERTLGNRTLYMHPVFTASLPSLLLLTSYFITLKGSEKIKAGLGFWNTDLD
jgi:hypothetical protein